VRANVLVVDDEAGPRESLRMILNLDHDVRLAAGGPEALEMIHEEKPDLVFLDIRMPKMDGTEVLRRIKEMTPDVEVAMITAYAAISSAQRAMRLGALDYITKPFGVAEVKDVVVRALARRQEQQEQEQLTGELSTTIARLSEQLSDVHQGEVDGEPADLMQGLASAHNSIEDQLNEVLRLSSIGEVAAEVAHDLNNFLSTILFRIEIMLLDVDQGQTPDPHSLVEGLRQIGLAARDGGEALNRISMLAKVNPYDPNGEADLNEILREAVELSQGRVDRPERHRVSYELEEVGTIEGSSPGLRTVFTNLVINAHHAIEGEGEICLRTFADGECVCAQVIDNGMGMSEEIVAHLEEPFFTTKGEAGTGLGLTVSHKVISQHLGTISFDSEPGQGTTVTVRLPRVHEPAPEQVGAAPSSDAEESNSSETDGATNMRVLVVDDHPGMRRVTRQLLEANGFVAETTGSPTEALAMFEGGSAHEVCDMPHAVITDLRMPAMSGVNLLARIRELAPETVILVVSAYLEETPAEQLALADGYLAKPCDLQGLVDTVRELLIERGLTEATPAPA